MASSSFLKVSHSFSNFRDSLQAFFSAFCASSIVSSGFSSSRSLTLCFLFLDLVGGNYHQISSRDWTKGAWLNNCINDSGNPEAGSCTSCLDKLAIWDRISAYYALSSSVSVWLTTLNWFCTNFSLLSYLYLSHPNSFRTSLVIFLLAADTLVSIIWGIRRTISCANALIWCWSAINSSIKIIGSVTKLHEGWAMEVYYDVFVAV